MDKKKLIQKFLNNKCTADEGAAVQKMLEEEPHLLDEILSIEDWNLTEEAGTKSNKDLKKALWQRIAIETRSKNNNIRLYWTIAVAASILILLFSAFYFTTTKKISAGDTAMVAVAATPTIHRNTTQQVQQLKLNDGSLIALYPGASVEYHPDFSNNRTIRLLSGKAAFDVAKDPDHPFTVISGNIATTALGTRFIVDQSGEKVYVRLYEGKVVVKSLENDSRMQPAYLVPGEQCTINPKGDNIVVASLSKMQLHEMQLDAKATPSKAEANVKFYNIPLSQVFEHLEATFDKHIIYNSAEVERLYFTGNFTSKDDLSDILNIITSVNGLEVKDAGENIVIAKAGKTKMQPAVREEAAHKEVVVKNKKTKPGSARVTRDMQYVNATLKQVFADMEHIFGVAIHYNEADIKGRFFTGSLSHDDAFETILSVICKMNQLKAVKNADGYSVMK